MKIIYQTETGVAIITPTGELSIEEVAAKDVPAGVPYRIVQDNEVPTDRTFRNAWKDKGGITVDMPTAVEITKERLRAERAPLLEAQDVAFQRAMETGDSTAAIVAEKKRLRDVTKLAEAPGITLEQLKALTV
jgi:hypothetical protein